MPVVNIQLLQDVNGTTTPVDGTIVATVNRALVDAYRVSNQFIIFPKDIEIQVVNGDPVTDLILTVLPAGYYWHIIVSTDGEAPVRRTVVLPGNVGPYDFEDLVDVDPTTALADAGTAAADAYADLIEGYAIRAEAAATFGESVVITDPEVGDILVFDGTNWVNQQPV